VADLTRADIAKLHHANRASPYQANRLLAVLSKMFNLAERWGLRPDGIKPLPVDRKIRRGQARTDAVAGHRIVPGALHITFCRSDHPHALISRISTAAAEAMPGVIGVYTARELNGLIEPVYATSRLENSVEK
jgi:Aldehyde oxidase and xanthine dehydrogenase, a/b hammerhead domain